LIPSDDSGEERSDLLKNQQTPTCRVTRWVFDNTAQKVADQFLSKLIHKLFFGNEYTNHLGLFCIFFKFDQRKQVPNGRKFAQSGHPAYL
jgi:hypothetical protein